MTKSTVMKLAFQAKSFFASLLLNAFLALLSAVAIAFALSPNPHVIVLILGAVAGLVLLGIYFTPAITAFDLSAVNKSYAGLKHPFRWIILFLNLLFGATGIVWLIIYIWAYTPGTLSVPVIQDASRLEASLIELNALKSRGLISEEEYTRKRASLLS